MPQLATVTGDATAGYNVVLEVGVDTGTMPAAGGGVPGSNRPSGGPGASGN